MGFQIMGTKHLGVPDAPVTIGTLDTELLEWPHAEPIYDRLCLERGGPSGHDYQAYLRPWDEI